VPLTKAEIAAAAMKAAAKAAAPKKAKPKAEEAKDSEEVRATNSAADDVPAPSSEAEAQPEVEDVSMAEASSEAQPIVLPVIEETPEEAEARREAARVSGAAAAVQEADYAALLAKAGMNESIGSARTFLKKKGQSTLSDADLTRLLNAADMV